MTNLMKAAVYYPDEGLRVEERPIPLPDPGELQVQVHAVGICGSDMHYYRDGHIADWVIERPHVLGHEFSGVITATGSETSGFQVGDRVAVEPCLPCGTCHACRAGLYNVCQQLRFIGSPHTDGAFQQYVTTLPRFTYRLPPGLDFELGALVEPTAVAVQAVRRSRLQLGETAAIIGAGPIGLLTLAVALASGASAVYVSDVDSQRLKKATEMGASASIDASSSDSVNSIMELTRGKGVDVVFEAVGMSQTVNQGIAMAAPGGRLTVIGVSPVETMEFDFFALQSKELDLLPVWLYLEAFPAAIALLASGRVDARSIVTHHFPLAEMPTAMDTAVERRDGSIKVIVNAL